MKISVTFGAYQLRSADMMSVDMGNLQYLMEKDDKYQFQLQTVVNCRLFIQTFLWITARHL